HQLFEPIERHDSVGCGFRDPRIDVELRPADARVDGSRDGFTKCEQLRRPSVVAGDRNLDIVEYTCRCEGSAEPRQPTIDLLIPADLIECVSARGPRSQLERDEERDIRFWWNPNAELAVRAIFAEKREATRIDMFDSRNIDSAWIAGTPGVPGCMTKSA